MIDKSEADMFSMLVFSGKNEEVKAMINSGIDLNQSGSYCLPFLISAVEGEQPQTLELLLKNGADPNIRSELDGFTALHWAVDAAIDGMIQTNTKLPSPKSIECIDILLKYGADVNIKDDRGETALDVALNYTVSKEVLNDIFPKRFCLD